MAPLALIEFDLSELTLEKRWESLIDNCKILIDEANNIKIYSKNRKGDKIFKLNPSYNAPDASISVVKRMWNELCLNHKEEHIQLVLNVLRVCVCAHLINPTSRLDFTSVGKKLPYNDKFFTSMQLDPTLRKNDLAIVLIPAVISSKWPYFFVERGIMS
jgi:hypothetical protein